MRHSGSPLEHQIKLVETRQDLAAFIEVAYELNKADPYWVPPLRSDVAKLVDPRRNPWFEHANAALFVAFRNGSVVGRISAQIDDLILALPQAQGGGAGHWGMLEAADEEAAHDLLSEAECWLAKRGMTRAIGPFSLSIWDQPGLLVDGFEQAPTVMMGHNPPAYGSWVESYGYRCAKTLDTFELDVSKGFPKLIQRIIARARENPRIVIRNLDKARFADEARLILSLLNTIFEGTWSSPSLTEAEIRFASASLKPILFSDLVSVAYLDSEPVAFMITLPDISEMTRDLAGRLSPIGLAKLLWRLRGGFRGTPRVTRMRVPLMGIVKRLQRSSVAMQIAFLMIERQRIASMQQFGATIGEIGWIMDTNDGMRAIAAAVGARRNKSYRIYEKELVH